MEGSSDINIKNSVRESRIIENLLIGAFAFSFGLYAGFLSFISPSEGFGLNLVIMLMPLIVFVLVDVFSFCILTFIIKAIKKIFPTFGSLIFFILGLVAVAFLCVVAVKQWSYAHPGPPPIISASGFATNSESSPIVFISPAGGEVYHPGDIVPIKWSIQQKSAIPYKSIDTWYVYLMRVGSQSSLDATPSDVLLATANNGSVSTIGADDLKLPSDISTGTYQIRVESDFLPGWAMSNSFTVE